MEDSKAVPHPITVPALTYEHPLALSDVRCCSFFRAEDRNRRKCKLTIDIVLVPVGQEAPHLFWTVADNSA